MAYSRILFDLDGTLTESGPGITHAVQYALQQVGIEEPDREKLECFVGPPLNVMFRQRYGMDEEESARAIRCFREVYDGGMIFENRVYPGVPALLEELHGRGIRLAIASSKPQPMVEKVLEHFSLREYFDVIVGAASSAEEDNRSGADHKLMIVQKALTELGLPSAPEAAKPDCAMVGDRSYDIKGARFNHVAAIGVSYGYGSEEELEEAGAEAVAGSVEELHGLLLG